jgi:hypothetical protein
LTPTDNRLAPSELSDDRDDLSQQQLDFGAVTGREFEFVMRSNNFVAAGYDVQIVGGITTPDIVSRQLQGFTISGQFVVTFPSRS